MKEKNIKTHKNNPILFEFEQGYWQQNKIVCGIDEVGRGCLAGPIITAAVILNSNAMHDKLKDSKLLSSVQLEIISKWIMLNSTYSIGMPLTLQNTPYENIPIESWTQGESKSASIAAASIIAKVTRDNIMKIMHNTFPSYGLNQHKGYGTPAHIKNLKINKACVVHRTTFIKNFKGHEDENTGQQNLFC